MDLPKLADGYAFRSSRIRPRDPATVVVGRAEREFARFCGTVRIDGVICNAWKSGRWFYFQTATELLGR